MITDEGMKGVEYFAEDGTLTDPAVKCECGAILHFPMRVTLEDGDYGRVTCPLCEKVTIISYGVKQEGI